MKLDSEKLEIINWIVNLSDESIIHKIKLLREQDKNIDCGMRFPKQKKLLLKED